MTGARVHKDVTRSFAVSITLPLGSAPAEEWREGRRAMNRIEEVNTRCGGGEGTPVPELVVAGEVTIRAAAAWVIDEALLGLLTDVSRARGGEQHPGWSMDLADRVADAVLSFVDANGTLIDEAVWS
jgi:hypothetical protein